MFATVGLASVRHVRTRLPAYLSRTRSGVRRISTGELLKLGFEVAQSTVSMPFFFEGAPRVSGGPVGIDAGAPAGLRDRLPRRFGRA